MLRLIGTPLMCLALFSIAGGHWAVIQSVAWARMLVEFSQKVAFPEAFTKTFDGKHPCDLCHKVRDGKQKEEQLPTDFRTQKKTEIFAAVAATLLQKPNCPEIACLPDSVRAAIRRTNAPPEPVPIGLLS